MRTLHLVVLMLVGAAIGNVPMVGRFPDVVEQQFANTIFGAFCGLAMEMVIRALSKNDFPTH